MFNRKECAKLFGLHKYIRYITIGEYTRSYIADERWSVEQYDAEEKRNLHILQEFME